jgi:hypothetical protein
MSNSLAIAAVTTTLRNLLLSAIPTRDTDLSDLQVTTLPPDLARKGITSAQLNLFLYQTEVNAAWRNMNMPRQVKPGETAVPPLALDLCYMLTAYGRGDNNLDAISDRVMGGAMSVLHDHPLLGADEIDNALPQSSLADQFERIRITPKPLTIDELSKLWTTMQTPYRITAAYHVSVVLIESTRPAKAPLPVREYNILAIPSPRPVIDTVTPQVVAPGDKLTIQGQNLKGAKTKISFAPLQPMDADTISDTQIEVTLPGGLFAGINTVQILHLIDFGTKDPSEPHRGFASNMATFMLAPQITTPSPLNATLGASLSLTVTPPVSRTQNVALIVGSQTITIPPRPSGGPQTTSNLDFPIPADFPTGTFLLRLRVDGADSPLQVDTNKTSLTFNQYIGPMVTIT